MIVEIITTGTELLLGQVVNTNSAYLANQLNKLGFDVLYHSTIGDNKKRMKETLLLALARADIVITTGGMGPTQGDITKEIIKFVSCRITTLIMEVILMVVFVSIFKIDDMISKIILQVVVLVLNYIFSKIFVFKGGEE